MRDAILSVFIFITIMFVVFFFNNSIINLCDDITTKSNEIELCLLQDDLETSYALSLDLLNNIKSKYTITSVYLNHTDIDNLITEGIKLSTYILHGDRSEASTSLYLLQSNTSHIRDLQIPKLENLF